MGTYVDECVPALPKITFGNDANGFSKLRLDIWRNADHQADNFTFDCCNLVLRKLVVSIFVLIILVMDLEIYRALTVQLRRMKFLKQRALASLVCGGQVVSATSCKRANENFGVRSACFNDDSAAELKCQ